MRLQFGFVILTLLLQGAKPLFFSSSDPNKEFYIPIKYREKTKEITCQLRRENWAQTVPCSQNFQYIKMTLTPNAIHSFEQHLKDSPPQDPYLPIELEFFSTDTSVPAQWIHWNHKPKVEFFYQWKHSDQKTYCLFLVTDPDADHIQIEVTLGPETRLFNTLAPLSEEYGQILNALQMENIPLPKKGILAAIASNKETQACTLTAQDGILFSKAKAQTATSRTQVFKSIVDYVKQSLKNKETPIRNRL